jgi:hypothetical protein
MLGSDPLVLRGRKVQNMARIKAEKRRGLERDGWGCREAGHRESAGIVTTVSQYKYDDDNALRDSEVSCIYLIYHGWTGGKFYFYLNKDDKINTENKDKDGFAIIPAS